ncbi:hypothetical protein C6Y40_20300 [Alteromonas alba]|uniref:DUF2970 domain-containing protein n=1 Tax=Alteromonas alba TaxID=2079529 RepID=A0A2S9V648_9ALTE|nr:DUF2970 domain-containing protein [Alteromonas alba]PRO71835.1 hypothetical protein C6Y40_20300 [Alteromonas alba]HCA77859.1 DUF2970 domain-containing protein [Alteromonas sp.]HCV17617.1 DUF2970 domain-containing protein [Alteromonas sp.]
MANKPGFLRVVQSVLASAFGVQSQQKYQQDFSQTTIVPYIVVGIIFVVLLVLGLIGLVNWLTP